MQILICLCSPGLQIRASRDIKASLDTRYEEGIEKGIEKVTIEMLNKDEPIKKIIKFTGLTKEQIEKLK